MLAGLALLNILVMRFFWKKKNIYAVFICLITLIFLITLIAPGLGVNVIGWWRDLFVNTYDRIMAAFDAGFNFNMPDLDLKR